jgi:hypothetical protein
VRKEAGWSPANCLNEKASLRTRRRPSTPHKLDRRRS